jgi:HSP20 family protein
MPEASAAPVQVSRESKPAIRIGPPGDGIRERLESIARRAFEIFQSGEQSFGHDIENWLEAERQLFHPAHVDVSQTDDAFQVRVEVPGFESKDLEVNVNGRELTITGKREKHEERKGSKTIYTESCSDQILRVVDLPDDVNADSTKTILRSGILEIEIAKAPAAKKAAITSKTA